MKDVLLQIGKHSSIYLIAQVIANALSVLMLPIYLRYFTPAEFGCVALIEVAVSLMTNAVAPGMIAALNRFHFEAKRDEERSIVWWTGFLYVAGALVIVALGMMLAAGRLASLFLGAEFPQGSLWLRMATLTMCCDVQGMVFQSYLRSCKQSTTLVSLSILRSTLFVACAIPGIIVFRAGPTATLLANLIAASTLAGFGYAMVVRRWGPPRFSGQLFRELFQYGWPFFITGLLLISMQSLNRIFVERLLDLTQVGLLSLGVQVADKVNRLIVMPFQQIWGMLIFELHEDHPDRAVRTYSFVFELFCYVLISVFFGCSVAAGPVLSLIARSDYLPSVPLIPILCLAQFFFAMREQFQAPMRLTKQTYLIIPPAIAGVAAACLSNWLLIPWFGVYGASWATVVTYVSFSGVSLWLARQITVHPYPFRRIGAILGGVSVTYAGFQAWEGRFNSSWQSLGIGLMLWLGWTLVMGAVGYREYRLAQPHDGSVDPMRVRPAMVDGEEGIE